MKGFRKDKKPTNAQREQMEVKQKDEQEAREFMMDFQALCMRKRKTLESFLSTDMNENGTMKAISTKLTVVNYEIPKEVDPNIKPWSECARENLETREGCKHTSIKEGSQCKTCGLAVSNWGEDNQGVKPEYKEKKLSEIEGFKKEEQEAKPEETK